MLHLDPATLMLAVPVLHVDLPELQLLFEAKKADVVTLRALRFDPHLLEAGDLTSPPLGFKLVAPLRLHSAQKIVHSVPLALVGILGDNPTLAEDQRLESQWEVRTI